MRSGYKSRKMLQWVKLFLHELKSECSLLTQIKCLTFGAQQLKGHLLRLNVKSGRSGQPPHTRDFIEFIGCKDSRHITLMIQELLSE